MRTDRDFFRCQTARGRAIQAAMGVELAQYWDELETRWLQDTTPEHLRILMACDHLFWHAERQVAQERDGAVTRELQTLLREDD